MLQTAEANIWEEWTVPRDILRQALQKEFGEKVDDVLNDPEELAAALSAVTVRGLPMPTEENVPLLAPRPGFGNVTVTSVEDSDTIILHHIMPGTSRAALTDNPEDHKRIIKELQATGIEYKILNIGEKSFAALAGARVLAAAGHTPS